MKKIWLRNLLVAAGCSAALLLTGCYTQVGTTENERTENESYTADDSAVTGSDSTTARDYEYERRQMYFDYYYPSFVFSVGYSSPWYWGPTWWYSPYWTPYWYGYAWYAPIYYPGWYYPYYGYSYHGYPYYGYPYPGGGSYAPYATRSFGNTRTVGTTRGYAGSTYSTGSMIDAGRTGYRSGGVTTGARATPGVRVPTAPRSIAPAPSARSAAGQRYVPPRRSGASSGSGGARVGSGTQSAPDHGSRGGAVRSGGGSYSPPPSSGGGGGRSGGGSSSPPPSSGGGGGGSRGGNHR